MSRSGYVDDLDPLDLGRWRGCVASAIRGKRGQALLRSLRDALDAMPVKRLIAESLVQTDGEVCALGCLAAARGIDVSDLDPEEPERVAAVFDVNEKLVREIVYENDEGSWRATPEQRWANMRKWVERHIKNEAAKEA